MAKEQWHKVKQYGLCALLGVVLLFFGAFLYGVAPLVAYFWGALHGFVVLWLGIIMSALSLGFFLWSLWALGRTLYKDTE